MYSVATPHRSRNLGDSANSAQVLELSLSISPINRSKKDLVNVSSQVSNKLQPLYFNFVVIFNFCNFNSCVSFKSSYLSQIASV